jgi:hypothetical protein
VADEPHEHIFREIYQSDMVAISEETTHQTITVELFDRGVVIHMERDEALELARAFTAVSRYIEEA